MPEARSRAILLSLLLLALPACAQVRSPGLRSATLEPAPGREHRISPANPRVKPDVPQGLARHAGWDGEEPAEEQSASDSPPADPVQQPAEAALPLVGGGHQLPPAAPMVWTLADVERIALANNPTLPQAQTRILAARGRQIQGGLSPNPTVSYLGAEIGNEGEAGQQGILLGQDVITGNKLGLNRRVAGLEIERARHEAAAQELRVLTDVRKAYYAVLIARRRVELAEQLLTVSEQSVTVSQNLLRAQQVSRVDLLQAQIEAQNARIRLEVAQNRLQAAWRQLTSLMGVPCTEGAALVGSVEADFCELCAEELLVQILAGSPELAAAEANVARARAAVRRAEVEPVPNLNLQSGVQYDHASQDTIAQAQLGVILPVHDRNQGNIRVAQAELIAAQREVDRLRLQLANRLAAALEQYGNARSRVAVFSEKSIPAAREALDLVAGGYREGEFDYLRYLTAQRTYFEISLASLEALGEWWQAKIEIDGLLLTDGLQSAGPERQ